MLGAAAVVSSQEAGEDDANRFPGIGGTALGALGFVDVLATPKVSVGGEISWALSISGRQSTRGANFVTHHRNTIASGTVKVLSTISPTVGAAGVLGFGLARRHFHYEGHDRNEIPPYVGPAFESTDSSWVPALTGGLDVLQRGRRVGLLFVARVHYLLDDDRAPGGNVDRGVSNIILRFGGGLNIRF
jgi:hypothetical protein